MRLPRLLEQAGSVAKPEWEGSTMDNGTGEVWKSAPGWEGIFEVSNLGRVRSLPRITVRKNGTPCSVRGRILRPYRKSSGHLSLSVPKRAGGQGRMSVHALVAEAFLGPRPDGHEIRHLDGNPSNNQVTNLAYGTRTDQRFDDVRNGVHPMAGKTHCIRGHEFTPDNTRVYTAPRTGKTHRFCRSCERDRRRKP
ncbi:NUMOD4 motif-containing HNH endonuclease [Rhodococcus pyridinivorans]|uniref:NUMOD4 motif-containing HNH endonuclease n=1 Tax=Rhodococcus pyridinivorans TaxID=103816 RepID=UPI003AACFB9B